MDSRFTCADGEERTASAAASAACSSEAPSERALHALRESHRYLAALVADSGDSIITKDFDGIIQSWNPGAQRLFGYTAEQALGQPIDILVPPDRRDEQKSIRQGLREGRRVDHRRTVRRRADGRLIDVSLTISPIRDDQGQIIGASEIARDITGHCRTERKLARTNRLLKAMVQASPVPILLVGMDDTVRMWNRAAVQTFGWSEKQVLGRPLPLIMADRTEEWKTLRQTVASGRTVTGIETVYQGRDGASVEVQISGAPLPGDRGRISSMLLTVEDVTERRRAERAVHEERERLQRQDRALAELSRHTGDANLREVMDRITRVAGTTLGVERASVWLFNEDRRHIRCESLYELSAQRHSRGAELSATQYPDYFSALERERVIAADDACSDPHTAAFTDGYLRPLGISSMLDAPIVVRGRIAGVVCHEHVGPVRRWTAHERAFAASVADLIAAAFEADQRRTAEAALRDSEGRLRQVTDGVPALISYVDREERYGFCNSAYKKWFGCPVEQLRGRTLREVLGEAAYAVVEPYVRAVLGGQAVSYDALLPYKDGGQRWVHAAYTPDHDEDGQVRGYFAIIADVTPHKQAEQTLREHAHTLNILNRLSNSLSGELDLDTVVQMVADAGTELSGARFGAFLRLEPDGSLRLQASAGLRDEPSQQLPAGLTPQVLAPVLRGEGLLRIDDLAPEAGGRDALPLRSLLAVPIVSHAGRLIGVLCFGHPQPGAFAERSERFIGGLAAHASVAIDNAQLFRQVQTELEERRKAEKELERLNATLEARVAERTAEVNRRMAQLRALAAQVHRVEQRERARLARVLHDHLQQLLVAAMIQLDLAGKGRGRSAKVVAEQAARLVRESIEVSRSLTADLSPPVLYEGSLTAALQWLGRHMAERHALEVEVDAPEVDTPEGLSEDRRVLLFQSVRELLFNVVKHAGVKGARIIMHASPTMIEATVEDDGRGLPPSQPQAASRPDIKGSGFGLMSMRERLEYVGGELLIDSQPDRYTRVTVRVPLEVSPEPAAADEPTDLERASVCAADAPLLDAPAPLTNGRRRGRKKIRVLLADDHKMLRDGLAGLLRAQSGIEVVGEAANGQEAVELTGRLRPDVIVMDISMPLLNGIEATRRIAQQYPGTRIVGLSMHEEADMTAAMLEAGAESYLTKGGPAEDLVAAIYGKPETATEPQAATHS